MERTTREDECSVGVRARRLAALSYFSFPLASVWGALLVRFLARDPYARQHAVAALSVQAALGVVWIPINILVIVGATSTVGLPGVVVLVSSILVSWVWGVLALRGRPAPAFTRRWAGN